MISPLNSRSISPTVSRSADGVWGDDVDEFVVRYLLEPSCVRSGEGRSIVGDDKALDDKALDDKARYWAVLNAIADGARRRGESFDARRDIAAMSSWPTSNASTTGTDRPGQTPTRPVPYTIEDRSSAPSVGPAAGHEITQEQDSAMTASSTDTLRFGLVGAGFNTQFHLRALEQVRGVEVAGLTSRTAPHELAASVRARGLGPAQVFDSVREMTHHVDVVGINNPNFARVDTMEQIAAAVADGAKLRGIICEKPLGRNMAEARRVVELAHQIGVPTAYFENQIHMKSLQQAKTQLAAVESAMGPLTLARSGEEHAGPHNGWFWDPTQQGGGVLSDMGCHCLAVGWYLLTPAGKHPRHLIPQSVSADVGLLKWGQPTWREQLKAQYGVDYSATPAEDFATGIVTYLNPDSGLRSKAQFTVSWMYDKQGLRLLIDGIGPGYALEANSLRSPLEIFIGDAAATSVADSELALEKATASRGLLAVQPNEPDLYGYTDENREAVQAFREGRSALLDFDYGLEIVRLTMAAYLSAEEGRVVDLTDAATVERLDSYVPAIQRGEGAAQLL
jgi:predicted dehydrogenase